MQTRVLAPGSHFGNVGSLRKMGPLIIAESHYTPLLATPRHEHETASFTMVFGGSYLEEFATKQFECRVGSALFRPPGEIHRDRISGAGARCLMVEMPSAWLQRMATRSITFSAPRHTSHGGDFSTRIRRELAVDDELSPMVVEAFVVELACESHRDSLREKRRPRWLAQLRDRIESEFAALPSQEILARNAGVHPGHMARAFRQHFGCTIGEYARQRKVAYCCEQLENETESLCDLAAKAGFSNQAHLTRLFKLHTGMTPAEFRRMKAGRVFRARM